MEFVPREEVVVVEQERGRSSGRARRAFALAGTIVALLAGLPGGAGAQPADDGVSRLSSRGWEYLIEKLIADGVERRRVEQAFFDPRVEPFDGLDFSLKPRESSSLYRGFTRSASIALARRCRAAHDTALTLAERHYGVPASVIASIIHIESGCGRNTGSEVVLWRLARLAMANEPDNLRRNILRHSLGRDAEPDYERLTRERAQYLEDTFYPEVLATFQMAARLDLDPLGVRGSSSGAFGMPQFLPRSYLSYGSDGNGDGRISLYDPDDAIFSCANYLAAHGWRPGMTYAERRRVIWHYNRSDAYIDAVLGLADRLDGASEPVQTVQRKSSSGKASIKASKATKKPAKKTAKKSSKSKASTARAAN